MTQTLSSVGIGASEIAAICGLNPFMSPWDIWLKKTGQAPKQEQTEVMEWGLRLEPAIRQKYCDVTGETVSVPKESLFHPAYTWARATPDGIAKNGDVSKHLVQIKNVSYWMGREWESGPPSHVQMQTQWEMLCTGLGRDDVACLIGGSDFRIFTIHRDDKTIADLLTIATDFWRRCEQRIPPEIDNSEACREHFEKRFAKANAIEIVADAQLEDVMSRWHSNVRMLKTATKEVETLRNVIRSHMAEAQADRIVSSLGIARLDANKKLLSPKEWAKGE